ncbi:MAG: hypothetical protein QOF21_2169 [Actinomycetota bacterium]
MTDERGRVSRRAFLAGGGALALGAVGIGIERVGWTDLLHKVGLAESPDHHVPNAGASVRKFVFDSKAMRGSVRAAISAPSGARGIVICLHGRNSDYMTAFNGVHVHDVVAAAGARLAVVSVAGGADSYWHRRRSGIDPQAMLQDELLPRVDNMLGASLPRALMGWSMGGYGALLTAERHPNEYRAVVASSPALWLTPGATSPGAFDDAADYRRNDVFGGIASLGELVVRVDCGTSDPFVNAARAFASRLPKPNPGGFTNGFHDQAYWRSVAPAQIATIAAALG